MQNAAHAYLQTQVGTTGRGEIIVMLYDGALRFLAQAKEKMEAGDVAGKGILISRALDIINELDSSLNMEAGGDLAQNLHNLYFLCNTRLLQANLKLDTARLDSVVDILSGLRSAFAEIINTPEARAACAKWEPRNRLPSRPPLRLPPAQFTRPQSTEALLPACTAGRQDYARLLPLPVCRLPFSLRISLLSLLRPNRPLRLFPPSGQPTPRLLLLPLRPLRPKLRLPQPPLPSRQHKLPSRKKNSRIPPKNCRNRHWASRAASAERSLPDTKSCSRKNNILSMTGVFLPSTPAPRDTGAVFAADGHNTNSWEAVHRRPPFFPVFAVLCPALPRLLLFPGAVSLCGH